MTAPSPNAYLQTKVMTASPAELRMMLFDGAIRFATQAREGLSSKNFEAAFTGITRCQNIILELINGLKPEHDPELCNRLSGLYTYIYTRLMQASSERNTTHVDEVLHLLKFERETWSMVLEQLAAENRAASKNGHVPQDVAPTLPLHSPGIGSIIGGTVSVRG